MKRLLRQPVFVAGGKEYSWADVIQAADQRGEWEPLIRQTRRALALLEESAGSEEPPVSEEELDDAAQAFRVERRLLTSEDTEAWLQSWGFTVEGWLRALEVQLLLQNAEELPAAHDTGAEADGFEDALFAQALVSGDLERFADRLAEQVAVAERLAEAQTGDPPEGVLSGPGAAERNLDRLRALVLKGDDVEAHLRAHQEEFTHVVYKELRLPQEEMAREATLAIRDDGTSVSSVAGAARVTREEREAFLKDVPQELAARLFTMSPGELSEVQVEGGEYVLHLLVAKTLPRVGDPEALARAEADLLQQRVRREVRERVKWLSPR